MSNSLPIDGGALEAPCRSPLRAWFSRLVRSLAAAARANACARPAGGAEPATPFRTAEKSILGGRTANEDRCYANPQTGVLLIADGMGGHAGGALASHIAVETMPAMLESAAGSPVSNLETMQAAVEAAAEATRQAMIRAAALHPRFGRMGCTLAAAMIVGDTLFVAHVGDCRCYHWRRGRLQQLTRDETVVQAMLDCGTITPQQARSHPWRHRVLNWLGTNELQAPPQISAHPLEPRDRILLTTDGLTDVLDEAAIRRILRGGRHPQAYVDRLVQLAVKRGALDNVSCILAEVVAAHRPESLVCTASDPAAETCTQLAS